MRLVENRLQAVDDDDHVERHVDAHEADRERDGFVEPAQENRAEDDEQQQRDDHRMIEPRRRQRILNEMRARIGRRQRDRDHEVGRSKAEQAQDDDLALPARKQFFENENAALPVRAHRRDAAVHRQRAEERQQDEDERGDRRERAGGDKRDAGLIGECREVIHAGEAHDFPPGGRMPGVLLRGWICVVSLIEPLVKMALPRSGLCGGIHQTGDLRRKRSARRYSCPSTGALMPIAPKSSAIPCRADCRRRASRTRDTRTSHARGGRGLRARLHATRAACLSPSRHTSG